MRTMIDTTLKMGGHNVTLAEDGVEGLTAAKGKTFDLVLTDVNMPNMDGLTLLTEIRKLPGYLKTPLIVLTTVETQEAKNKAKLSGATAWMVKPFTPDKLLNTIKAVIK